jgi:hypothetical protein
VILRTYDLGTDVTSLSPKLAYALDHPASFWVWTHQDSVAGVSIFSNLRVSDGVALQTVTSTEFEDGQYQPVPTANPVRFEGTDGRLTAVVTANTAPVSAIAETQLRAQVKPDHQLVPRSVQIEVGDPVIVGQTVSVPVTASAKQVAVLDPEHLTKLILGKSIAEAHAVLEPFGTSEISVSPDWSGSIPSFESRVDLTVSEAVQIETPAPSGSAGP